MIAKTGGSALAIQGDVSSVSEIRAFYAKADEELNRRFASNGIDILVSNAGVVKMATFEQTTEEDFDFIFDTNVKGTYFVIQEGVKRMREAGRVILLSTGLTRFVYPQYIAYSASKGAIDVLTRYLAAVLGPRGITVNAVAPGAIDTDINAGWLRDNPTAQQHISQIAALGRVGKASDIADVIGFLASNDSRWITGERIEVSGGAHL